jgi:hypothetical protein
VAGTSAAHHLVSCHPASSTPFGAQAESATAKWAAEGGAFERTQVRGTTWSIHAYNELPALANHPMSALKSGPTGSRLLVTKRRRFKVIPRAKTA